jgi:hypothetical protein
VTDPKRLLDETSRDGDLGRLLSAGQSELPNDAQLGSLAAKLGVAAGVGAATALGAGTASAKVGAGAGAGTAASAAGVAAKTGIGLKLAGALVLVGAVGTSAVVVSRTAEQTPQRPVGIVATVAPVPSTVSSATSPLSDRPTADEPTPAPSASAAPPKPSLAPAPSADLGPQAEVRLLERAQDALRSRPADALSLADEHARQFPRGMLVQEREVIAIEALMKTGRTNEAKARAARFKARFPGSSHTRRIEALVGDGQ